MQDLERINAGTCQYCEYKKLMMTVCGCMHAWTTLPPPAVFHLTILVFTEKALHKPWVDSEVTASSMIQL
jgi:hypothetical protein